ncbi:dTMP kinase [Candidatus Nitrosacidococcus tergens]|uniref:Thymidylate kinase n=1 Tax=Candidatus Nitrosacidococcus tergens TaxID=553981 RepID=A0A7G1Q9R1_9GAMM|nr:dTMP kinase [Candidatus Nitrosacidococcus tergens]CAB1275923.1 Thymidylate kinase [Candidatus Nitrosacidococcus tergens]
MRKDEKGYFISLEGIDGAGKSTQIKFIQQLLERLDKEVILTREPGGTPLGEKVREILLSKDEDSILPYSELLLIFAARVDHLEKVIMPALAMGKWVICERFTDSSYAYQGGGRELPLEFIQLVEKWTISRLQPNLTFLLDLPVNIRTQRKQSSDRFEQEQNDFFERVRVSYLRLAKQYTNRYCIIDASLERLEIQKVIEKEVINFLSKIKYA